MQGKKVTAQMILGQQGVTLVQQRTLAMGFIWYPSGNLEAGIDGHIELRDAATSEALNSIIQVQSKATRIAWPGESADGFDFYCDPADVAYWIRGNAPVILICSRPPTGEAYWVDVKACFADAATRASRKVHFNKASDSFDTSARERLFALGAPRSIGVYFSPPPTPERLLSNLLPVRFPNRVYQADTAAEGVADIWRVLAEADVPGTREWVFHNKRILSYLNLREHPLSRICDLGTLEEFPTSEWAESDDVDKSNNFTRLLNECLRAKLEALRIRLFRRERDDEYFFFEANEDGTPRLYSYTSLEQRTRRTVVGAYASKRDPKVIAFVRHSAFRRQFLRIGSQWLLAITPTYHFTVDGRVFLRRYQPKLKGIKAREHNLAVLGQVWMWAYLLKQTETQEDLFPPALPYPFIEFEDIVELTAPCGISDGVWLPQDEPIVSVGDGDLPLFSEPA